MPAKLFIFWMTLLPFVVWGGFYEGPKVAYFLAGIVTICGFLIFRFLKSPISFKLDKKDFWFLLWLVVLLAASLLGIHPALSILGGSYRHQGVLFFFGLWLLGKSVQLLGLRQKKMLIKWLGIGVLVESLIVVAQFVFGRLYFGRPLGTLGETNAVAGYLAMGITFSAKAFPLLAIFLAVSRAGILAAAAALVRLIKSRLFKFLLIVISLSLVFFISIGRRSSFFEDRIFYWRLGIESLAGSPLLGYGAESTEVLYDKAFERYQIPLQDLMVDRSHNLFLDITLWSGVIGLVFFAVFLFQICKKPVVIPFLIFSFFQPLSVVHWILLMALINV